MHLRCCPFPSPCPRFSKDYHVRSHVCVQNDNFVRVYVESEVNIFQQSESMFDIELMSLPMLVSASEPLSESSDELQIEFLMQFMMLIMR